MSSTVDKREGKQGRKTGEREGGGDLRQIGLPGGVRRGPHGGLTQTMVAIPESQHIVVARVEACHHDRHIIRLAPAVHKVSHLSQGQISPPLAASPRGMRVFFPEIL